MTKIVIFNELVYGKFNIRRYGSYMFDGVQGKFTKKCGY